MCTLIKTYQKPNILSQVHQDHMLRRRGHMKGQLLEAQERGKKKTEQVDRKLV